jgi:hypothetical protein
VFLFGVFFKITKIKLALCHGVYNTGGHQPYLWARQADKVGWKFLLSPVFISLPSHRISVYSKVLRIYPLANCEGERAGDVIWSINVLCNI